MKKMIMTVAVLAAMTTSSLADVRWGRSGGDANIVTTNRPFISKTSTFNTTSNSSPVATYYTNWIAEGASRNFSAAASTNNYYGYVMNGTSMQGDYIQQRSTAILTNGNFKSMVLWDWAETSSDISVDIEASSVTNSGCISQVRFVIELGGNAYGISQSITDVGNTWATNSMGSLLALEWYDFSPFQGGNSSIGEAINIGSMFGVTGIGYYLDSSKVGNGYVGGNVRYFEAQAVPEPSTAILLAIGGGIAWLLRLKQWL